MIRTIQTSIRTTQSPGLKKTRQQVVKNNAYIDQGPSLPKLKQVAKTTCQLIFGEGRTFNSEYAKQRHENKEWILKVTTQMRIAEFEHDQCPGNRYKNSVAPNIKLRRYDKEPVQKYDEWSRSTVINGEKKNIFSIKTKSYIDTDQGSLVSVNGMPIELLTEPYPELLASWIYKHVASTNKQSVKEEFKECASKEISESKRDVMRAELDKKNRAGSPLTSATKGAAVDRSLQKWGQTGKHIEINTDEARVISPDYAAALIMHWSDESCAENPVDYKWREDTNLYPERDPVAHEKIAAHLSQKGIDPDGAWTRREQVAYFTEITQEHLFIGSTPAGSARVTDTPQS